MKPYIIRKSRKCGCWQVFQIVKSGAYVYFREIAHFESWGDVLVFMNLKVWVNY